MNESKVKEVVIAIANRLRDNCGQDCCGIRRDNDTGAIRDVWYKIHFARHDGIDSRDIWKFDPNSGDSALDFDLSFINQRYFSAGKTLYAIRKLTPSEAQNIPNALISAENDNPFIQALELVYSFTLGGDDSKFVASSTMPTADFIFTIDGKKYIIYDRTYELALAQCAVNIVRKFYN